MLPHADLENMLQLLPLIAVPGPWTRAIGYHLLQGSPPGGNPGDPPQPLWPGGAALHGGRLTPKGGFGSIYLASDPATALSEVGAVFENPGSPSMTLRTPPWTVFAVQGAVEKVLDVTDDLVLFQLRTSLAELTGDWRFSQALYLRGTGPMPPTQLLGECAFRSGRITGIQYRSAKRTGEGISLVVFADRILAGGVGYLEVYDPHGLIGQRLP